MTLINCRECGKEISDTSKRCIHCGAKIKKEKIKKEKNKEVSKNKKKLILIILGIILIIGTIITIYFLLNNNVEQTNLRDDTKSQVEIITDYINIRENPNVSSDVLGKVYQGEIYTILSENNDSEYKWIEIETSNGIRGYISGVEDYVKRLYLEKDVIEEESTIDNPVIGDEPNNENTDINDNRKPNNNNTNNNQKPNNNNNSNTNTNNNNSNNQNNTSTNENDKNQNTNEEPSKNNDTNIPYDNQVKELDATLEYYCNSPWKLNGKTCEKIEYSGIKAERRCSFGYVMSADGTKCIGESRPDKTPNESPVCIGGSNTDIFTMTAPPYYGCRKGTLTFERKCPTGYSLVVAMGISRCVWDYTGKETYVSSNCSYSYPVFDNESGQCINRTVKSAYIKYTCPSGYTLKGKKCYR